MKNKLPKYEQYKPSGTQWLGDIPQHWEVIKFKYLFNEINERSNDGSEDLLSVSQYTGVTLKKDKVEDGGMLTNAETLEGYKKVKENDLVSNIMLAWNGSLGFSPYNGITSPAYCIYRLQGNNINKYFHYLLRTELYKSEFKRNSSGVIESRLRLYTDDFFKILSLLPPLSEQEKIAEFLDEKTTKIDKAIEIKQRQIELLKERRQILIHRAVTRGVGSLSGVETPLKDSGIEWIGEIPEHWEVKRLKTLIKDLESGVSVNASESESAENNEIGVLKTSCVYNYRFDFFENKKVFKSDLNRVSCPVRKDAIIISRMNAPELVGASGYVFDSFPNLFLPDRLWQTVFYENIALNALWMSKVFIIKGFRDCLTSIANGSSPSMKNISKGDFLNLSIPVPPFQEQTLISEYIEVISAKIAKAISLKEQEIEKLKEYKSSLINSAVTGKVKIG